jgi:hypothetical protein
LTINQISQSEQGVELGDVLGQPAIAQLFMTKEVLDDVEGVFDPSLRQRSLRRLSQIPQRLRQGIDDVR